MGTTGRCDGRSRQQGNAGVRTGNGESMKKLFAIASKMYRSFRRSEPWDIWDLRDAIRIVQAARMRATAKSTSYTSPELMLLLNVQTYLEYEQKRALGRVLKDPKWSSK